MTTQYIDSFRTNPTDPDTTLGSAYTAGDSSITVSSLPADVASKGASFWIKIDSELFRVTGLSGTGNLTWAVTPDGRTADVGHTTGTGVYLEHVGADHEVLRDRQYVTAVDETANLPNSRTLVHDHSGSAEGTVLAPTQVKISQDWGLTGVLTPSQITSDQNDYAPSGIATCSVLRLSTDASRNLTGITAPSYGRRLVVENVGSHPLVLKDANTGSAAANRFALGGSDVTLAAGINAELIYDTTLSRWVMIGGTGSGSGTVTEASLSLSDVTTDNVTSTAHGFAPKSPADATKFLNGAATPAYAQVKDSDLAVSDVTTNNASTSAHGFLKKLSNVASQVMNGVGNWVAYSWNDLTDKPSLPTYTITNQVTDRTYDADATTVDELADVIATLIADRGAAGMGGIGGSSSGNTPTNEFYWPPPVRSADTLDLDANKQWWRKVNTPTGGVIYTTATAESIATTYGDNILKCVAAASGDGLKSTWTYANERRVKSGRYMAFYVAVYLVTGGRTVTISAVTSTPTTLATQTVTTTGSWQLVKLEPGSTALD